MFILHSEENVGLAFVRSEASNYELSISGGKFYPICSVQTSHRLNEHVKTRISSLWLENKNYRFAFFPEDCLFTYCGNPCYVFCT